LYTSARENRILLNIGGISNFTFLPQRGSSLQAFATDVGPGNTIMNQYMSKYFGKEMDENGEIAASGTIQQDLLESLLDEDFLRAKFPKTTGPELFNLDYLDKKIAETGKRNGKAADIMATLNAFSAGTIVNAIQEVARGMENVMVYGSGGGIHNSVLVGAIQQGLPGMKFENIAVLGMNPDAKEACLFALLANETVAGSPKNSGNIKDSPPVCMGKISFPQ
ncbi:MAG TPA: anhydro-N-acetylmuramic acid kinase, partial [Sphingobacterium sp.]|nr:anhydro-N-acetylmuramic acid kinase [Sphingobacterium sp.]